MNKTDLVASCLSSVLLLERSIKLITQQDDTFMGESRGCGSIEESSDPGWRSGEASLRNYIVDVP